MSSLKILKKKYFSLTLIFNDVEKKTEIKVTLVFLKQVYILNKIYHIS